MKQHPAIVLANDRPCSGDGASGEWAIDAEDMLRKLVYQNEQLLEQLRAIAVIQGEVTWSLRDARFKASEAIRLYTIPEVEDGKPEKLWPHVLSVKTVE